MRYKANNWDREKSRGRETTRNDRQLIQITINTDGQWFNVQGDQKDETGIELHLSTDGSYTDVAIHVESTDTRCIDDCHLRVRDNRPA
jgi:hypothetical protein